jgi:transcriptional regulator GlxA family with amidase domain
MPGLRVAILAYEGCLASELFGFRDVLALADQFAVLRKAPRIETQVVTINGKMIATSGGERFRGVKAEMARYDMIVVPGFLFADPLAIRMHMATLKDEMTELRAAVKRKRRVASICVGAYVLGAAGLLDGRNVTTAWLLADHLASLHPKAHVELRSLIVEDGPITTTGAFTAGHDLALRLIETHQSPKVARDTRSIALIDGGRAGQAPFIDRTLMPPRSETFGDRVATWLTKHMGQPYSLAAVASAVGTSQRTLLRRFKLDRGETPLAFLQSVRIDRSKAMLAQTELSIAEIGARVGYADVGAFRALFQRLIGMPPGAYRRRFKMASRPPAGARHPRSSA